MNLNGCITKDQPQVKTFFARIEAWELKKYKYK